MRELKERDPIAYQKAMIARLEWLNRSRKQTKEELENERHKKMVIRAKSEGICVACLKRKAIKNRRMCVVCKQSHNQSMAKRLGKPFSVKVGTKTRYFKTQTEATAFAQKLLNNK